MKSNMKNALIINAAQTVPGVAEGKLNGTMAAAIAETLVRSGYDVRHTAISAGYAIDDEVKKHVWADLIICQSPVFWFGLPWPYKKYIDEVLTAGLMQQAMLEGDGRSREHPERQYGSGGKLHGRRYMLSLTWNAPADAFGMPPQDLFEGKTVDDVFISNTANYKFCGAKILRSFSCFDVVKNPNIEADLIRLHRHLESVLN